MPDKYIFFNFILFIKMSNGNMTNNCCRKVVIVGAGAAGLGAAHVLTSNGFEHVIILEATHRIGGRVHTVPFGTSVGKIIELGANWIHGGTISNPLFTRATAFQFGDKDGKLPSWNRFKNANSFLKQGGELLDPGICKRATEIFFEEERALAAYPRLESQHPEMNLLTILKERLRRRIEDFQKLQDKVIAEHSFNALLKYLQAHVGDDLHKASTLHYGTYNDMAGDDMIVPQGFQSLLRTFVEELSSNSVKLGHVVTQINWDIGQSCPSRHQCPVTVTCQNGSQWHAEHVIVTTSLGYLKEHHRRLFQPNLPTHKIDAIENIGFGCTDKVFLEFERPFWNRGSGNFILTWSNDEIAQSAHDQGSTWTQNIFAFNEVYANPTVLVGWVSGDGAKYMEHLSDKEVAETCVELLKQFTGNPLIPPVKRIVRSAWGTDPFVLGSYSYASTTSGPIDVENLACPLPSDNNPSVLFAGEATHPNYYSTVHGALLSGIREANRIVKLSLNSKM